MLREVLEAVSPKNGGIYVDGTFGAGGYTRAFLQAAACTVLALDRDPEAIADGRVLAEAYAGRLILREGRFSDMAVHVAAAGFSKVDGVALDVGVSSMQLDQAERGFSFMADGPLDMRMEQAGLSAADVVNTFEVRDLAYIIRTLGEERRAGQIARAIAAARTRQPITRTGQLADIVERALGGRRGAPKHPATRTFQALRIYVNRELEELGRGLYAAEDILNEGGRLAVVAFHSLEDRIVKRFLAAASGSDITVSRHMPAAPQRPAATFTHLDRGGIAPGEAEAQANPRARSARLRAGIRTGAPARAFDAAVLGLSALPVLGSIPGGFEA